MGKGGGKKGKDKGKGKSKSYEPEGPPEAIEKVGEALHSCEDELVLKVTNERIPHFNARIFLENKEEVGKIDEIFGPINSFYCSAKLGEGMKADSFKPGKDIFIDTMKLLPLSRFLPGPGGAKGGGKGKGKKGGKGDKGKGKGGKGKAKGKFGKDKGGKDKGGGGGRGGGGGGRGRGG